MGNRFGTSEWNASIADLGTLLPLAFALATFNGFAPATMFFLWGIAYIISGWWFRLPLSVQPLKAMSVIAIASALPVEWLTGAAIMYGIVLLILSLSGIVDMLQRWFSPAIVSGIQTGIGLILIQKALELVWDKGLWLHQDEISGYAGILFMLLIMPALYMIGNRIKWPVALFTVLGFMAYALISGAVTLHTPQSLRFFSPAAVPWHLSMDILLVLIIPQLPLTLGNAMYAASDACHRFWPERAQIRKITPKKLGISIGLLNMFIGSLGGFPMCHGAGGIGAYKRFGARSGGTVIITGGMLIILALVGGARALFFIPVPFLAALLALDALRMAGMIRNLNMGYEWLTAAVVAVVSLLTRNLTLALLSGLLVERLIFAPRWRNVKKLPAFYAVWLLPARIAAQQCLHAIPKKEKT